MSAFRSSGGEAREGEGDGGVDGGREGVMFDGVSPSFEMIAAAGTSTCGEGETGNVSVGCASLGQDGEMLINTIEVSTDELMSMGHINGEEVEFIYSPNIQFQVEARDDNGGGGGGMEGDNGVEIMGSEAGGVTTIRIVNQEPRFLVHQQQSPVGNQEGISQSSGSVVYDIDGCGTLRSLNGGICQTVGRVEDAVSPSNSFTRADPINNVTLTTIDGKKVSFRSTGGGVEGNKVTLVKHAKSTAAEPEQICDPPTNPNVIFTSNIQGMEQQLPVIIKTVTLAQQTVNAALTAQSVFTSNNENDPLAQDVGESETLFPEKSSATVQVEVTEGTSVVLQKYYYQPGLCRVCLLTKDNLSSIFEDVSIDSYGMVENSRGPNAANKFHLLAALRTLLDIEVEYNDGLPHSICMDCYDQLVNFSVYRKKIAIGQTKLNQVLDQVKNSNTPTFIPVLGEVDMQKTDIYKYPAAIETANTLLNKSQYSHFVLRNISNRIWDKIFSSFSSIVGFKSGKLKNLEHFTCDVPYVKGYFCYTCNSTIHGSKNDFAQHHYDFHGIISSEDILYPCDICGNSYPLKDCTGESQNYSEHWLQHFFLHECTFCNKKFPSTKGLWVHKKSIHSRKEKLFVCEEENCAKSFSKKIHLDTHRQSHSSTSTVQKDENIECSKCSKCFRTYANLNVHLSTVHGNERPWKCDIVDCQKRFKRKEALISHKQTVHMNMRKYQCEICNDTFKSQSSKVVHMLRHKGEKQHTCPTCLKQFYTTNGLKSHMLKHQDVGDFQCDQCSKIFKRAAYLEEHKRTHTGEKPFTCPVCSRSIRMKSNYFKHMRIHKRKNEIV